MKPLHAHLIQSVGGGVGLWLCMAFYGITGLTNTCLSSAPALRQAADFTCLLAFVASGMLFARCLGWVVWRWHRNSPPPA